MAEPVLGSQSCFHHLVEVAVVGKLDMTPDVPSKTRIIDETCRKPPGLLGALKNREIVFPELLQSITRPQSSGACANDEVFYDVMHSVLSERSVCSCRRIRIRKWISSRVDRMQAATSPLFAIEVLPVPRFRWQTGTFTRLCPSTAAIT